MSFRLTSLALLAAPLLSVVAACQAPPSRPVGAGGGGAGADPAVAAYCRQRAEEVYNTQNRSARIQTDSRDSPFSGSYVPSVTSRGLSDRYAMDAMISDCMRNSSARAGGMDPEVTMGTQQPPARAANRQVSGQALAQPGGKLPVPPPAQPTGSAPQSTAPQGAGTGAATGVPLDRAPPPPPPVR